MKLNNVLENASTGSIGSGNVSAVPQRAFKKTRKKTKKGFTKIIKRVTPMKKLHFKQFLVKILSESANTGHVTVDPQIIASKLRHLEKHSNVDQESTTGFVIEDENGQEVKIWVRSSEAAAFEKALSSALNDKIMKEMDTVELIFELRKKFDIVDAKWPTFVEDEEELPADDETEVEDAESEVDLDDVEDIPMDDESDTQSDNTEDDESTKSLLQQIIQAMSAEAEAKKAEAEAKKAEAEAKSAEYAALATEKKIRDQEQILDMEEQEKIKKEKQKEAEQMAKLAKYRHELRKSTD